ncbi:DUF3168 domain-containing protein [Accumulibacter sp.]|jgi:Protein of unknown function (DUF3168).|uniref:DUF3168 domain-containing protein n=1 Tax=Accumulibacter sp. TaxID=2053492 RepID=UPI001AD4E66C|nr:DUF3168 domain-containing protein [Accumulibacter sp.]MBN8515282.1 DUF3168 domain-containing protein [Accumulibacter sp.]MBO3701575.1 DUF3168 domain-containing protein [Accumulibacter sp.]
MNLFSLVSTDATCVGLLGAGFTRFFEFGTAPTLETVPYATWQEIQGTPFNVVEGAPSTDMVKAQIDVWASAASEARAVSRAIRRAIDTSATITFYANTWDEGSRLYRTIMHCIYAKEI